MAESEIEQFKQNWRAQVAAMADAPPPSIQQAIDVTLVSTLCGSVARMKIRP